MSTFVWPDCWNAHGIFGEDGGSTLADGVDVPFLGTLRLAPAVRAGGDDGEPIVTRAGNSETAVAFEVLARTVTNMVGVLRRHHRQTTTSQSD